MTILTKPSIVIKKPDGTKSPLVDENCVCDEEKVIVYPKVPVYRAERHSTTALLRMMLVVFLLGLIGMMSGLMIFRYFQIRNKMAHFKGFCAVPIDNREFDPQADQLIEPNYREHRVVPLQWSSEPLHVFTAPDPDSEDLLALPEEISIADRVESIRVKDNGRTISFVHDFDENATGIIDEERCFITDLDPQAVLAPDVFLFGIERGEGFDVSRVRATLRAVLPALAEITRQARMLAEKCQGRPLYRLQKEEGVILRKRSADAPPHDYIQFAGKHVQEIEISNLADLLDYERNRA